MSSLWLALTLVGTFLTVVLVFVVVDMVVRERRRPVTLLESQLGQVTDSVDLRQQQLEGSIFERLVIPGMKRVGAGVARLTPLDLHGRIEQKLILAGSPPGLDAERVVALKIGAAIGCFALSFVIFGFLPISGWLRLAFMALFTLIGYIAPSAHVSSVAGKRQSLIRRQLPDVMDLLTISVEAGLGFDAAMAQVVRNVPGPLAEEMARLLQEVQIGSSRTEAFRHLGERTDVSELQGFVLSMIQADLFGVSVSSVLRAQSRELRQKRRQRAEEIAQKIPVKLLFPMIFLVLPALFVIVLGPGAIKIYNQFFG
jgi:tight adherence protein C